MRISISNNSLLGLLSLLILLGIWKVAAVAVGKELILPDPSSAWRVLANLLKTQAFWHHFAATLWRGLAGFGISFAAGLGIGVASGVSQPFDALFRPLLVLIRSTPTMALILLALIWFRSDAVAVFVTFLVVFPIVAHNVSEGIRSINPGLLEMARLYRVPQSRVLFRLSLPAILPHLAAGAVSGLGITWKVIISAEVLAGPRLGIGTRMDQARVFLNTPEVFAWTAVVVVAGFFFDRFLESLLHRRLSR